MFKLIDYDWPEIMLDFIRLGMTQRSIASEVGVITHKMVHQYMVGKTPIHWRGEAILAAWERKTGKSRSEAPKVPAPIRTRSNGRNGHRFAGG